MQEMRANPCIRFMTLTDHYPICCVSLLEFKVTRIDCCFQGGVPTGVVSGSAGRGLCPVMESAYCAPLSSTEATT